MAPDSEKTVGLRRGERKVPFFGNNGPGQTVDKRPESRQRDAQESHQSRLQFRAHQQVFITI